MESAFFVGLMFIVHAFCFLQDWVVGKYGRVMPVVHLRRKDKKKVSIWLQTSSVV